MGSSTPGERGVRECGFKKSERGDVEEDGDVAGKDRTGYGR